MNTPKPTIEPTDGHVGRTRERRGTLFRGFQTIHGDFPTVVTIDSKWQELLRRRCGINYVPGPRFLMGARGFLRHYNRGHGGRSPEKSAVHIYRILRAVSNVDVAFLKAGQRARNHLIQKVDHPNDTPAPNDSIDSDSVESQPRRPRKKPTKFVHLDYRPVVEIDGIWVELTCKDIAANAVRDSSEFMQSEMAFRAHAKRTHDAIANAGLARYYNMGTVSARDIDLIQVGQNPTDRRIEHIGCFAIAARAANVPRSGAGLRSQLTICPSAATADPGYGRGKTAPPSKKKSTFSDLFGVADISDSNSRHLG
ncbi:hypothetical protein LTR95_016983 [Oleoguttula sp. CCFEE 5521]